MKQNPKKWLNLFVLFLGMGSIYKLAYLSDIFYVPMQETFNISNTQIGFLLSIYAITQTLAYAISTYISDRVPTRVLISSSLIITGLAGFYFSTMPNWTAMIALWAIWGAFCEGMYWPSVAKAIRGLGPKEEQGRLFGIFSGGRGIVDTIVALTGTYIAFSMDLGLKGAIIFFSVMDIVAGLVALFFLPKLAAAEKEATEKVTMAKTLKVLRMPEVWLVTFVIFFAYICNSATTYFNPYLHNVFEVSNATAAIYGIVIAYGLKIAGGPMAGFFIDLKIKSVTKYLRIAFMVVVIFFFLLILTPASPVFRIVAIIIPLVISLMILSMRGTYTATIDEVNIPAEVTGAAVSIASLIGYLPTMFANYMFGSILDSNPGVLGYRIVFGLTMGAAIMGFIVASLLIKKINKNKLSTSAI
jgi:sugar phosphate permease